MINICKTRKFPDYYYFLYDLNKHDRGKYLNTWFYSDQEGHKVSHKNKEFIYYHGYTTFKQVDETTSQRKFNPVIVFIMPDHSYPGCKLQYRNDELIYSIKAEICSIDDSSYGIWLNDKTFDELKELQTKVMEYVNENSVLNGDEFIKFCISIGFDEDTIDYN